MAANQFLLTSDSAGGQNKFLLDSDDPKLVSISFSAQQAQQSTTDLVTLAPAISVSATQAQQITAPLTNWAYTTLVAPIYTGPGSVVDLAFFSGTVPKAGDIIAYDASTPPGLLIASDGSLSWTGYGTVQAQYNDGVTWYPFLITSSPWIVWQAQSQQSVVSVSAAPSISFSAVQDQQSNSVVGQVGLIGFSNAQAQQFQAVVRVGASFGVSAQQSEQASVAVRARVSAVTAAAQLQQAAAVIATTPAITISAQQGQQTSVDIVAQTRADIATVAAQLQQSAASIKATPIISGFVSAQQQQTVADVLVPQPVLLAIVARQQQQSAISVGAQAGVSLAVAQLQQSAVDASAFPRFAAIAAQLQQISVSLPNLPSPAIDLVATQLQQCAADVGSNVVVSFSAAQQQTCRVSILPLPGQLADLDTEGVSFDFMTQAGDAQPDTKIVYLGRDNATNLGVLYYGVSLDLGPVTHILIEIPELNLAISSNDSPDYMSWNPGSNVIKFKLGSVSIPIGIYAVSLVVYDIAHPNGQVLAGPAGEMLMIDFARDTLVA